MLSKSKSLTSGPGNATGYKKKKAPPRPPPPSANRMSTSQSFHTPGDLQSQKRNSYAQRPSYSVDIPKPSDLIDFGTPPGSPESKRKSVMGLSKPKGPPDFMYRVGASIFYVKSELKNSNVSTQAVNPFSPPRPSAQSLLSSPVKQPAVHSSARYGNVPAAISVNRSTVPSNSYAAAATTTTTNVSSSMKYNPTIIKRPNENNNSIKYVGTNIGGSFRSSSGSSDWSDFSQPSHQLQQQQPRYGNIPMPTWDEPPAQNLPPKTHVVQMPTIIKPPTTIKPSLLPKPALKVTPNKSVETIGNKNYVSDTIDSGIHQRNYYDDPPDSDFDEDDEFEDSIISPPMPSEPPPPPPPLDVAVKEWVDSTQDAPAYHEPAFENQGTETDRAYAITLYDYIPDVDGDLPLQAGDLVYLIKKIDDAWLYGQCAGYEGMFPSNFVNIVVPLQEEIEQPANENQSVVQYHTAEVLYQFDAETESDLNLRVGEGTITIYGRMNDDWLYGEMNGSVGQFPAAFVSPVPLDLPIIPNGS